MLRILYTCLLISLYSSVRGQDTLSKLSGEKIFAKVIANKLSSVEFTYSGETSVNIVPKSLLEYIVYASGRKEIISKLVDVTGQFGWKNVMVTTNPDDVVGLVRLGEVRSKANNAINLQNVKGIDVMASERIQKEAAGMGGHIILMLQNATKGVSYGSAAQSFKSGIAYGYPFKTLDSNLPYKGTLARRYYGDNKEVTKADPGNGTGKKVLFDKDGQVVEGIIEKRTGNFFKIKFVNKKGREEIVSRHIDQVEVSVE